MPTPPPADSAVPPIVWQHADDVLVAEDEAARAVAGPLRNQLDEILAAFQLRWVREFGPLASRDQQDSPGFRRLMADLAIALTRLPVNPVAAILDQAERATALGVRQGYTEAGLPATALDLTVPPETADYAGGVSDAAAQLLDRAARMATTRQRGSFAAVTQTLAAAQQAPNTLDRAARTVVNERINAGISAVTKEVGGRELWIAERDACVHCLALSGHLIGESGLFDASLTFGGKPLSWLPGATIQEDGLYGGGELTGPPRHPRCRCRVTPWFGHDTAGAESITHDWAQAILTAQGNRHAAILAGDRWQIENANRAIDAAHQAAAAARRSAAFDLPAALRREAERSVLNGWALPSEPVSVRSKAAERLLTRIAAHDGRAPSGWQVPKSVRKGAERDLKKGTFRTRSFPA